MKRWIVIREEEQRRDEVYTKKEKRCQRPSRNDADRNCISNVRPEGLKHDLAAFKLAWLLEQSFIKQISGVRLKDESDNAALSDTIKPLYIA